MALIRMIERSPLAYSLSVQLFISVTFSLLALILGQVHAYSFALGAILFIVPNLYFTYYAFRFRGTELTDWIRRSFMWGQMGKLALAAVGFALVFRFVAHLHIASLFAGYIVMILTQWWLGKRIADAVVAGAGAEKADEVDHSTHNESE